MIIALATVGSVVIGSLPAAAHNVGVSEVMYSDDAYLAQRVVEVTDTADVTLGVEWSPTVDGFVTHITFCLDVPINSRIPVWATLWTADGTRLGAVGGATGVKPTHPAGTYYWYVWTVSRAGAGGLTGRAGSTGDRTGWRHRVAG
ncbi:MAG TPA: hypothetical protein VFC19_23805 [Candidatus Limnocylindrales bacterium]|nr:hypothetical protein [Candidatus Limnocylindrales bacterium]